ncbi:MULTISPECIES: nitroreductase/quinone reductase family protein [unclassified Streptomyces]|uniref:nitroreductase/quinone reductase family protein n=1 Tax=unclassified Streptomyces TaxID=2593676 RepID=UPI002E27AC4E|nr:MULTISPECIES: nitroreductase/quinone reductase family protein [unclassified Streptomyces]
MATTASTPPSGPRQSGLLRRTALAYVRDEDAYVLTASNAGADRHPAWYLNLLATPEVTLQVGTATFPATARPATAAESARLWPAVVAAMPSYTAYRTATSVPSPATSNCLRFRRAVGHEERPLGTSSLSHTAMSTRQGL